MSEEWKSDMSFYRSCKKCKRTYKIVMQSNGNVIVKILGNHTIDNIIIVIDVNNNKRCLCCDDVIIAQVTGGVLMLPVSTGDKEFDKLNLIAKQEGEK